MSKINNDKYYTSNTLAKYCVEKTIEIIGEDNISEFVEPSAGNGVFINYFTKPYKAFDILPENTDIVQADWLKTNLSYKKGRCIIGNPPFGERNILSVKFYKHSIPICDYIAFILPISQLNNNQQMYEFDLLYSEDLGIHKYSDRNIHCCFNIYSRPKNNIMSGKQSYNISSVIITEFRSKRKAIESKFNFDIILCFWGSSVGKIVEQKGTYSHEWGICILDEQYKQPICDLLKNTDWHKIVNFTATPAIYQWQLYKYILEQFPEINKTNLNLNYKKLF